MRQERNAGNGMAKVNRNRAGSSTPEKGKKRAGSNIPEKDRRRAGSNTSEKDRKRAGSNIPEKGKKREGSNIPEKDRKRAGSNTPKKDRRREESRILEKGKKREGSRIPEKDGKREGRRIPEKNSLCPVSNRCGGCQLLDMPYGRQLQNKQKQVEDLLKGFCKVYPIVGMDDSFHYRNKVHAVFGWQKGKAVCGTYREGTHEIVPVEQCLIEDKKADEIIGTIGSMLKSFKIRTYDEDTGYGFLRHVLVRRGFATGEIMVVLVTTSPIFPSRNHFVKALRERHPEITTIIQNLNDKDTSMILGEKEKVLYGKGYIEDVLCGYTFRISSRSFYQINPVQTEKLYTKAVQAAALTGTETVIDAYCGIGTIGITASRKAGRIIGVELNQDAVRDAVQNAKRNKIENIQFYHNDAGKFMAGMAADREKADVVFMDPPRSGSTEEFIESVALMGPERVVYISCCPETLARDLEIFEKKKYKALGAWPFDMFPHTGRHVECVVALDKMD